MSTISKDKRDRLILVVIVAVIALVGLWMFVVRPQHQKISESDKAISDLEAKISKAERLIAMKAKVEKDLSDADELLNQIEEKMPSGDLYGWAVNTLNSFRDPYNVNVVNIKREVVSDVKLIPEFPYESATFGVELEGHYHDIGRLVSDLENAFPFVRIQNPVVEPVGNSEVLNIQFQFVALVNSSRNS